MPELPNEATEYELFGHPHTTTRDCDFLERAFSSHGPGAADVLDIACGTGRHALEMARRGYSVTAIDNSEQMLDLAINKASAQDLNVTFHLKDMTSFDSSERFDAAYMLFNTIVLLTSNDDLIRFMKATHSALKPQGLLVMEVGNLWAYIAEGRFCNGRPSGRDESHGQLERHVEGRITVGPHNNVYRQEEYIHYRKSGRPVGSRRSATTIRAFSLNELDLLCRLTGFVILQIFGLTDPYSPAETEQAVQDPSTIEECENAYRSFFLILGRRSLSHCT